MRHHARRRRQPVSNRPEGGPQESVLVNTAPLEGHGPRGAEVRDTGIVVARDVLAKLTVDVGAVIERDAIHEPLSAALNERTVRVCLARVRLVALGQFPVRFARRRLGQATDRELAGAPHQIRAAHLEGTLKLLEQRSGLGEHEPVRRGGEEVPAPRVDQAVRDRRAKRARVCVVTRVIVTARPGGAGEFEHQLSYLSVLDPYLFERHGRTHARPAHRGTAHVGCRLTERSQIVGDLLHDAEGVAALGHGEHAEAADLNEAIRCSAGRVSRQPRRHGQLIIPLTMDGGAVDADHIVGLNAELVGKGGLGGLEPVARRRRRDALHRAIHEAIA